MTTPDDARAQMSAAWQQVAQLVNRLPVEQRQQLKATLRHFNHDLGDRIGLIRSAEALLRRDAQAGSAPCDPELMEIIHNAALDLNDLLQMLRAFAQAIED